MPKFTRIPTNRPTRAPEQTVVTQTSKGVQIRLHVKPNSNADRITDIQSHCVHVAVSEAAREGEANRGVIDIISGVLGIRKRDAVIVAGQKCRDKVVLIHATKLPVNEEDQVHEVARVLEKLRQAVGH